MMEDNNMKDCKFKELIRDTYKDSYSKTFEKTEFGMKVTYNKYFGLIYNAISTHGFSDIKDIDAYVDLYNPDMLYLKSRVNDQEIQIYQWDLKEYRIEEDLISIECKNGNIKEFNIV